MLFGAEHVKRYRETGGAEGHDWQGTTVLILTTTGRRSGELRSTPLIYREVGATGGYAVVASNGGGDEPNWYLNLVENPEVEVQVKDDVFPAHARVATADEKPDLWKELVATWPQYDEYQAKATREIPVVVLDRNFADSTD
ncbi:nitroreductase family deazaflavin-dependent oxidoreductase [Patulibacter sp. SYSU D01012]|uniref:nitroreductase family deazaflavin-dependent oxidoreductase n=1 Tax=Patulibacter sp. SYSU D01012 TaxID=2817381 RepID=UPI001B305510|nr:nitroreductase family deazaflavin-dependent oxidoreductase [Patulibacter sp. SYSU D01012]